MKLFLLALTLAFASLGSAWADSDTEAAARKSALDLAGAFANDGFKLRDGHWSANLETGKARLIEVNLYAGNHYWFSVATASGKPSVAVTIYDETGKAVGFEPYAEAGKAAAGFSPTTSGPYAIKIEELAGEPTTFCLLYSYK